MDISGRRSCRWHDPRGHGRHGRAFEQAGDPEPLERALLKANYFVFVTISGDELTMEARIFDQTVLDTLEISKIDINDPLGASGTTGSYLGLRSNPASNPGPEDTMTLQVDTVIRGSVKLYQPTNRRGSAF